MDQFGEYFFHLLNTPLKKIRMVSNQFYVFFRVIGKLYDDSKRDIFRVRQESMVITASEFMLNEHGKDRSMMRLAGEGVEQYRKRLAMKGIIAEQAGSRQGIMLALKALGYDLAYIEPLYAEEASRWAEFTIYLRGKYPSGVNDLMVIDNEVMRVKQASSKPSYGIDAGNYLTISSLAETGFASPPLCGTIVCGVYPEGGSGQ